jgi:hypothetical protein
MLFSFLYVVPACSNVVLSEDEKKHSCSDYVLVFLLLALQRCVQVDRGADADISLSTVSNADYFISKKAFFFDLSPWADEVPNDDPKQKLGTDLAVMKSVFAAAHKANNGKMVHMGGFPPWPYKYVTPSSCSSRSADERTQSCQRFKPHTHTHTSLGCQHHLARLLCYALPLLIHTHVSLHFTD